MGAPSERSDRAPRFDRGLPRTTRYSDVRLLGRGGMGAVHEVEDRRTGRRVAKKQILTPEPRQLLRFKREFRMMADLQHPNLVRLFDLGCEDGTWFFTMELVEGAGWLSAECVGGQAYPGSASLGEATLDSVDEAGAPSDEPARRPESGSGPEPVPAGPDRALRFDALYRLLEQLLSGLEHLHQHGIVHRDLKPSNVLVDRNGRVKIVDFGLACQHGHSEELAHGISRTGAALGTMAFMAPEQLLGEAVAASADMYALGCVLFQVITGRLPHTGSTARILHARLHEPPPRVEHYVAGVPGALCEVCRALMSRDPVERPTIDEVRRALGLRPPAPDRAEARPTPPSPASLTFVGREEELSRLEELLAHACDGEPCFRIVEGPSGIGKSALARQLVRRARQRGVLCFRGRCYEREHLPFVAFDRAIDALTLTLAGWPAARIEPMRPALRAASRIFPALGMVCGDPATHDTPDADARSEQVRAAFDGVCTILDACQRAAPVLIVLDDLQWSDEESVALLESIVARGAGRIFLLGLMRPPGPAKPALAQRLRVLARAHGPASAMELTGLRSSDRAVLIELAARDRLAPHLLAGLASQAEGNPLLTLQLIDQLELLESGAREAYLRSLDGSGRVIEALVSQFGAPARRLLQLAATAGGDVDEDLLREASGQSDEGFRASRQELLAAHMLKRCSTKDLVESPRRLDVFHDRIRETVYDALEPELRRELHHALALALEARQDPRGRNVEALLRHWAAAGEHAKCRVLALAASKHAEAKLAFRRAATLLRVALDGPAEAEDPQRAARWEHLGDLCEFSAQLDEALDAYRRALELWEATPCSERRAALLRLHGRIGETLVMAGRIREGRESLDRGFGMMGLRVRTHRPWVVPRLRGRLWLVTALPARWVQRSPTAWIEEQIRFLTLATRIMAPLWPSLAAELALRGTILGLRVGDRRLLQRLLATRVLGLVLQGRPSPRALEQARRDLDASEALATELEIPFGLEVVMMHRGLHAMATDTNRARRLIDDALEAMDRRGMRESYDGAIARALRVMILVRRGDYELALAAIEHETDHALNVPIVLFFRVLILSYRGRLEEAARSMAHLETCFESIPPCGLTSRLHIARLTLMVAQGRFEQALEEARTCERAWVTADLAPKGDFEGMWLTVTLEAALGRLRGAAPGEAPDVVADARLRARKLARRGTLDHGCMGHRALALLAHHAGHPKAAARALERALALSSVNASPHRRWLCLEAARDLGPMTLDKQSEARALAAEHGLELPVGWQQGDPHRPG